jgi:hypothetical protein
VKVRRQLFTALDSPLIVRACQRISAILMGLASCVLVFAQNPTPAPKGTLLVTSTCSVANIHGNGRSRRFRPDGIQPLYGWMRLVTPGEYRLFMHLIGPKEEYVVTCLGQIRWITGWMSLEHFQLDKTCAIPHGKGDGYWLGSATLTTLSPDGGVAPAVPDVGTYIPAAWTGNKLAVHLARDYHDTEGVSVEYTVLQTMSSSSRIIDPREIHGPYKCPNGELVVAGVRKCRPE